MLKERLLVLSRLIHAAPARRKQIWLIVLGLLISIPLVIAGSTQVMS